MLQHFRTHHAVEQLIFRNVVEITHTNPADESRTLPCANHACFQHRRTARYPVPYKSGGCSPFLFGHPQLRHTESCCRQDSSQSLLSHEFLASRLLNASEHYDCLPMNPFQPIYRAITYRCEDFSSPRQPPVQETSLGLPPGKNTFTQL